MKMMRPSIFGSGILCHLRAETAKLSLNEVFFKFHAIFQFVLPLLSFFLIADDLR